jgi:hypothetical protein
VVEIIPTINTDPSNNQKLRSSNHVTLSQLKIKSSIRIRQNNSTITVLKYAASRLQSTSTWYRLATNKNIPVVTTNSTNSNCATLSYDTMQSQTCTLKMEVTDSSETLVTIYNAIQFHKKDTIQIFTVIKISKFPTQSSLTNAITGPQASLGLIYMRKLTTSCTNSLLVSVSLPLSGFHNIRVRYNYNSKWNISCLLVP